MLAVIPEAERKRRYPESVNACSLVFTGSGFALARAPE